MAHKAVDDMMRIHRQSKLANMWYTSDVLIERQEICDEVCAQLMQVYLFRLKFRKLTCSSMFFNSIKDYYLM